MSKFAVILPAAGQSTRCRVKRMKKPFAELNRRPVWVRSTELFINRDDVAQTIIVISPEDREWFKEKFRPNLAFMDIEIVDGGAERADSIQNALARVKSDIDFVAVHDAARPLMVEEWVDDVFRTAIKTGAAMPAVPVTSTVKRVNDKNEIVETVPRENLWLAQTPQVFRRELLLEAYAKRNGLIATDDAQLVEAIGHTVTVVEGSPMNIKITTGEDFKIASSLIEALPKKDPLRSLHPFQDDPGDQWR
ncbi:2-C-methyl-D-erythritol 4-phosphate cytidylyltransferase [Polystyrenella longa]|uniref:2-C-methyl-D-erythritol 4-phosphate cytidylyltransferase n=1 Tax=Polystyrenella longa TaxID=2528007 RepID=A0A518CR11_9PLAN|nr:2-C-methyl-D-erythritol 4-phosphate cytidylyltransferase [Polystyrenella longa]QDU81671.1 2-C-methyl-D-erythritol 4-phosphate cytidylyltransferase [Polystyrenella longa]